VARGGRLLGVLLVVIATAGLAVALGKQHRRPAHPKIFSKGVLRVSNSLDGRAILTAPHLAPGQGASGQVRLSNEGELPGSFELRQRIASERAGTGGGLLSSRLRLTIDRIDPSPPVPIYAGPINGLSSVGLGWLARNTAQTYEFRVVLPEGGTTDDLYQGATLTASYDWTATATRRTCRRKAKPHRHGHRRKPCAKQKRNRR